VHRNYELGVESQFPITALPGTEALTGDNTCYQHLRTNIREARLHEPKIDQAVGLAADDYPEKNLWG